jgi:hypothetical protein
MKILKGIIYLLLTTALLYSTDDKGRVLLCVAFLMGFSLQYIFKEKK